MSDATNRVAVTGIGLVTALGVGKEPTWQGLVEGRSGVSRVESYDVSSLRSQLGGEVRDFRPEEIVPNKRVLRKLTRGDQFALAGSILAVADAGIEFTEDLSPRAGLFLGSNKEVSDLMHLLEPTLAARNADGSVDMGRFGESAHVKAYPLFYVEGLQAASLFYISDNFKLQGVNTYFAGTAEAGLTAIGRGYRAIKRGEADLVIAGGYDDALSWWNMTKLDTLDGYLTTRNELGAGACRPFDQDRDGTVLGEGASFLVLETLEAAQARGADIYAEVVGFGSGADAYDPPPHPEGRGLTVALANALREARLDPGSVDYIAVHGTGTKLGDESEAVALHGTFGDSMPAASSVKPATGHLVAAAGALNAAVAALAVRHGVAPPTLNLEHPDPGCNHADWIPRESRELTVDHALALARGFAGQNVALALKAVT
jgi:3-oxoacyl-[acyl-carrier-protein] synthase II